jgi:hypothetical protein
MRFAAALPVFAILLAAAAYSPPALAAAKQLVSQGDWEAYEEQEGGKKVCYLGSKPKKAQGKYRKRGDTYVLITHRPAEGSSNVISINAGYTYQASSEVEIAIGDAKFRLFTDGDYAFAYDQKADNALVQAMIKGAQMSVKGTSNRGTVTVDVYSLRGFTAAHKAIDAACGVK